MVKQTAQNRMHSGRGRKVIVTALAFALIACIAGMTAFAVLTYGSDPIVNTFKKAAIDVVVVENDDPVSGVNDEEFTNSTPKKVQVLNVASDYSIDTYVRVAIVPVWKDDSGNGTGRDVGTPVFSGNEVAMGDLTLILSDNWSDNWFYKDGFFYYKKALAPGEMTTVLLEKITYTEIEGEHPEVSVLAEGIQTVSTAAETAWGITKNADGTISA